MARILFAGLASGGAKCFGVRLPMGRPLPLSGWSARLRPTALQQLDGQLKRFMQVIDRQAQGAAQFVEHSCASVMVRSSAAVVSNRSCWPNRTTLNLSGEASRSRPLAYPKTQRGSKTVSVVAACKASLALPISV